MFVTVQNNFLIPINEIKILKLNKLDEVSFLSVTVFVTSEYKSTYFSYAVSASIFFTARKNVAYIFLINRTAVANDRLLFIFLCEFSKLMCD